MKCKYCQEEMKEETLFTTINYSCNCANNEWQTADEIKSKLNLNDFPVKLSFKDNDGRQGSVFITDADYFSRCPESRKFKLQKNYYGF